MIPGRRSFIGGLLAAIPGLGWLCGLADGAELKGKLFGFSPYGPSGLAEEYPTTTGSLPGWDSTTAIITDCELEDENGPKYDTKELWHAELAGQFLRMLAKFDQEEVSDKFKGACLQRAMIQLSNGSFVGLGAPASHIVPYDAEELKQFTFLTEFKN